jgi:hypothetical protein
MNAVMSNSKLDTPVVQERDMKKDPLYLLNKI